MKDLKEQDLLIAKELNKYHIASPSPDLHDHVLRAAHQALTIKDVETDEIPGMIPILRFAACLVIAVFLIFAGNQAGDYVAAHWQNSLSSPDQLAYDTTSTAGLADAPFTAGLVASDPARSQRLAREQFLNYRRQAQELLGNYQ